MIAQLKALGLALAAVLLASPAPAQDRKEKDAVPKGWGTVVDPDKDCKIRGQGEKLTIEVPGKLHDLSAEARKTNAPRVLQEVEGDFIADLIVAGEVRPGGRGTRQGVAPYNGAGLLLWKDEGTYVRLERAAIVGPKGLLPYANLELRKDGKPVAAKPLEVPGKPLHLRLERRGGKVIGSVSFDGVRWTALEALEVELPGSAMVGVAAVNTASEPFRAEFERFELFTRRADRP